MKHLARQIRLITIVFPCVSAGVHSTDAFGADADTVEKFHPYVLVGFGYDTNVFRVDTPAQGGELIEGSQLDDTISTIEAGFNSNLTHRRQHFRIHGQLFHNDYNRFDAVNFTGGDATVTWDWAMGNRWTGDFGYELRRALRDFSNQSVPRIDETLTNVLSATLARRLSNRVDLATTADLTDVDFSEADRLNLRRAGVGFSLAYRSLKENMLSLDGRYTERESQGPNNLGYSEWGVGPAMSWRITEGMRLRTLVQHTQRWEDDPVLGDYSGITGTVSTVWTSTLAHTVNVTLSRRLSTLGDEIANYAIVTGASIEPTVRIGRRAFVGLAVAFENRDFRGEPELSLPPGAELASREDDVLTGRLRLEWLFANDSRLSLEFATQERDSSRLARDYDFERVQLTFRTGVSSLFGQGD